MLLKTIILLCSAAILVSGGGESTAETKNLNKEVVPNTAEILSKNKTTTSTTTTSTTERTTTSSTTVTPETTTPPKTTTPSTTTTTTASTTTSTAAPPTPIPIPTNKKWSLNGTNETCIVVQLAARFEITYPMNQTHNMTQKMNLPVDKVVVSGSCDSKDQVIVLSWNSTMGSSNDSFSLHFVKDDKNSKYALHHMDLVIQVQELPKYNSTSNGTLKFAHLSDEYPTGLGNSYRCVKESSFKMNNSMSKNMSAIVKLNDVQFQAFKTDKGAYFGLAEDCAFDTPDVVPIAVGCALAALVVIVLVAYLIGRRRAQSRGYLSM